MRAHARLRLRQLTMLALVALTLGALHVEGAQLLHLHGGDRQGGIFTEQHVLATLFATSSSGAPLPAAAAGALLGLLAGFIALPEDVRPAASARRAAPRGGAMRPRRPPRLLHRAARRRPARRVRGAPRLAARPARPLATPLGTSSFARRACGAATAVPPYEEESSMRAMAYIALLCLALAPLLAPLTAAGQDKDEEIAALRRELENMRKTMSTLAERLQALEAPPHPAPAGRGA